MVFFSLRQMVTRYTILKQDNYSLPFSDKKFEPSALDSGTVRQDRVDARVVSDAIIGLSDGLTVPFALTAGLSAIGDTRIVVYGGLAELIAGAISMGLGGYLAAKSEEASYHATLAETRRNIASSPSFAPTSIADIFSAYDVPAHSIDDLTIHLSASPRLTEFLMHFKHTLAEPPSSRALTSALTIAMGYFTGGFIPLLPYLFVAADEIVRALWYSVGIMALALSVFGYAKTCFVSGWAGRANVRKGLVGAVQMVVLGGIAAGSAMALVRGFQSMAPP